MIKHQHIRHVEVLNWYNREEITPSIRSCERLGVKHSINILQYSGRLTIKDLFNLIKNTWSAHLLLKRKRRAFALLEAYNPSEAKKERINLVVDTLKFLHKFQGIADYGYSFEGSKYILSPYTRECLEFLMAVKMKSIEGYIVEFKEQIVERLTQEELDSLLKIHRSIYLFYS